MLSRRLGCRQGGERGGSIPSAYCSKRVKNVVEMEGLLVVARGGGGSLIIHQPGMSECDLGRNQTPGEGIL